MRTVQEYDIDKTYRSLCAGLRFALGTGPRRVRAGGELLLLISSSSLSTIVSTRLFLLEDTPLRSTTGEDDVASLTASSEEMSTTAV